MKGIVDCRLPIAIEYQQLVILSVLAKDLASTSKPDPSQVRSG
jgi:hypothetical protein